jgi:hypothetical protein
METNGKPLLVGTRVVIEDHPGWPAGLEGTIGKYPRPTSDGEERLHRAVEANGTCRIEQWVWFDHPAEDATGGGPYEGAEVPRAHLRPLIR